MDMKTVVTEIFSPFNGAGHRLVGSSTDAVCASKLKNNQYELDQWYHYFWVDRVTVRNALFSGLRPYDWLGIT